MKTSGDLVKLVVFMVVTSFLTFTLAATIGNLSFGGKTKYAATFSDVTGLLPGNDVRIAGVKVGTVTDSRIDPQTFAAELTLRVDRSLKLPSDTSAEITSEGLLGGKYVSLVPGGSEKLLADGGKIQETQGSVSLESLLGRFIFSVTQMNSGQQAQNQGHQGGGAAPATPR